MHVAFMNFSDITRYFVLAFRRVHFLCCFMLCYHHFIPSDCYFKVYCM